MKDLRQFATPRQLQYLDAIDQHQDRGLAAQALGVCLGTMDRSLRTLKALAARQGHSPEHDMIKLVPEGYHVKGVSTLYGEDGKVKQQWLKSNIDHERQFELAKEAAEAMAEDLPRLAPMPAPIGTFLELANVYTLTDSHVGMLAWREEGGQDWDLKIAEKTLVGCFEQMVLSSPPAHTCFVAQLGDFLHYDSAISPVTPMHGHILDADGRMPKMVKVAIRILRRVVDMALQRHQKVVLLLAEGNHDISSSVWLRAMFAALYENEPRVEVMDSELPYYAYQHGKTMLCWHHGHLRKNEQLPLLFAAQFAQMWGATTKRYAHTGHRHHKEVKEHSGMTVQQHSTITARDAHSARGGWFSERGVEAVTYHREYGQVGTVTITPEMLLAQAA